MAKMDGRVGPTDAQIRFRVDVGDDVDVAKVPSLCVLASGASLCFLI